MKNKLSRIFYSGFFIVILLFLLFLRFRFKPYIEIKYIINFNLIIYLLFFSLILTLIINFIKIKIIPYIIKKRKEKNKNINSNILKKILESFLNIYFLFLEFLQNIDNFYFNKFPKGYLFLCKISFNSWIWEYNLSQSSKIKNKIIVKLFRKSKIFPLILFLIIDLNNSLFHYTFWGLVIYGLCNILFKLRFYYSEIYISILEDNKKK